jgi:hypothetical protein
MAFIRWFPSEQVQVVFDKLKTKYDLYYQITYIIKLSSFKI